MNRSEKDFDAALKEFLEEELKRVNDEHPVTKEMNDRVMNAVRAYEETRKETKLAEKQPAAEPNWARVLWRLALGTAVLACLVLGPFLLMPSTETWSGWRTAGGSRGPAALGEMEFLENSRWEVIPDFKGEKIVLRISDGTKLSGKLFSAPELNQYDEASRRFFRLTLAGTSKTGLVLDGAGKLELSTKVGGPAPRLANVDEAILTFTLTNKLSGNWQPFVRKLNRLNP